MAQTPTILNIAAGKFNPLNLENFSPFFLVNLDTMYYTIDSPEVIERAWDDWAKIGDKTFHCNEDAFKFMENTRMFFDRVCIYRFLEHVSFTQLDYFIYLLSSITKPGATLDIIVPDYTKLARMISDDNPGSPTFPEDNILLTTELLNEPSCPHASIWTTQRAKYFFELENRFLFDNVASDYDFDGRDIYLRFHVKRI